MKAERVFKPFAPVHRWSTTLSPVRSFGRQSLRQVQAVELANPSEVVQEALKSLRKNDVDRFALLLAHISTYSGEPLGPTCVDARQSPLCQKDAGPLHQFSGTLDVGARRLMPENLLRRCQAISSIKLNPTTFYQRVAITAKSGEEGILQCTLKQTSGMWRIVSITRDDALPQPLPSEPHPRLPPEVVVAAMCKWLSMNVLWRAAQFLYGFGSRREKELRLHSMLKEDQRLLHLCQPRKALEITQSSLLGSEEMELKTEIMAGSKLENQRWQHLTVQSYIWTLCIDETGCWAVKSISL